MKDKMQYYTNKKREYVKAYNQFRDDQSQKISELKQEVAQLRRMIEYLVSELMPTED
jgi:glutaredoxin 2